MVGVQKKIPENSEISMLTVSNSEHDCLKRRRGLPSGHQIIDGVACAWRHPGGKRIAAGAPTRTLIALLSYLFTIILSIHNILYGEAESS